MHGLRLGFVSNSLGHAYSCLQNALEMRALDLPLATLRFSTLETKPKCKESLGRWKKLLFCSMQCERTYFGKRRAS